MSVMTSEQPTTRRNDVSVKVDTKAMGIARKAAALKGLPIAEYVSLIVAEAASSDLKLEARKITDNEPK